MNLAWIIFCVTGALGGVVADRGDEAVILNESFLYVVGYSPNDMIGMEAAAGGMILISLRAWSRCSVWNTDNAFRQI